MQAKEMEDISSNYQRNKTGESNDPRKSVDQNSGAIKEYTHQVDQENPSPSSDEQEVLQATNSDLSHNINQNVSNISSIQEVTMLLTEQNPIQSEAGCHTSVPSKSLQRSNLESRAQMSELPTPAIVGRQNSSPLAPLIEHNALLNAAGTDPQFQAGESMAPGHRRAKSQNETSYAILSKEAANQLHASWTNVALNPDDPLSFSSSAGFSSPSPSIGLDTSGHPLPVSRLSSTASSMSGNNPAVVGGCGLSLEQSSCARSGISSVIHDAARITNWEVVKQKCEEDPEAAKYIGKDKWTALHHACSRRCPFPDVVEALVRAYPDALTLEEDKGWYPLHYACRFKAPKAVVRLLLVLFPERGAKAVKKLDRQGRAPLYYAVRYDAPAGVVSLLLNMDASVVLEEDQNADSPLTLLWDVWAEKLDGKRTLQKLQQLANKAESETAEEKAGHLQKRLQAQSKVWNRWKDVNFFLKAAFGFAVGDDDKDSYSCPGMNSAEPTSKRRWRILHAAAAIKCHPSLFQLALSLHPEQGEELDNYDLKGPANVMGGWLKESQQSVLHLASSSLANGDSGRSVLTQLLFLKPDLIRIPDKGGGLPLHRIVENIAKSDWARDGASDIYAAHPGAVCIADHEGRLPLHRAATAIMSQGDSSNESVFQTSVLCNLIRLQPDAASHSDSHGRLPLHYAVEHARSWDCQIEMLYDAFPRAARIRTGVRLGNQLPLHIAASNVDAKFSLIQQLVLRNPRATSQTNRRGLLPLHIACEAGLSWEAIRCMHDSDNTSILRPEDNDRGWYPLHMAAAAENAENELLVNLVTHDVRTAAVPDSQNRYALHLACMSGKTWEGGLQCIFEAYPDASRTTDAFGLLPFHYACIWNGSGQDILAVTFASQKHRGWRSSRVSTSALTEEEVMDAQAVKRLSTIFNLLKADPTVL